MQFSEQVISKNHQFCVVNKPAGVPVQPDKTGDISLLDLAEKYFKQKMFLIHRLDRPVSGIILFAKKDTSAALMSELFRDRNIDKTYLALVENKMPQEEGTLEHQLDPSPLRRNKSYAKSNPGGDSHIAVTKYKVLGQTDNYTLVQLNPLTGRHHQIRAQLAAVGCPIKGDVKYGARRGNKDRSIALHAWKITFMHPVNNEINTFEASLPEVPLWNACLPMLTK